MPHSEVAATEDTFDRELAAPGHLVIAEFWGDGCPNCDVFHEAKPSLLSELGDVPLKLVTVDAYAHPALARRFGLFGIPAFLLFRDGRLLGRMSEYRGRQFWLGVVRDHLPATEQPAEPSAPGPTRSRVSG
ncbi:MAG TPA: thioredoxin family protein [Myxococcaceae bacterium]|nr:thioredoxin family protein [Myxococcaceae bacterium]